MKPSGIKAATFRTLPQPTASPRNPTFFKELPESLRMIRPTRTLPSHLFLHLPSAFFPSQMPNKMSCLSHLRHLQMFVQSVHNIIIIITTITTTTTTTIMNSEGLGIVPFP
jgi:hypothetical protein